MYCESCGVAAETRHVAFYQNIGLLVLRYWSSVEGEFCKTCISRHFWTTTTINLLMGWWGIISFLINPFIILNNVIRYLASWGMEAPGRTPVYDAEEEVHRPAPQASAVEDGCYLCGGPLQPGERRSRVCQACS